MPHYIHILCYNRYMHSVHFPFYIYHAKCTIMCESIVCMGNVQGEFVMYRVT